MRVLVACEYSGVVRDAFIARGHDALSCDLLPTDAPGPHYQGDVTDILGDGWDLMVAHPPCTRLANSGVRWLHSPPKGKTLEEMWDDLRDGAEFYRKLRDCNIPKKALENPVMHRYAKDLLGDYPRQIVQPWWFGDPFFKATGFELHGLPPLTATQRLAVPSRGTLEWVAWSAVHRASPGPGRAKERSRFFPGMAKAMAEQWS